MILVLMLIDFDHKILPNIITLPGVLIGLLLSPLQDPGFFMDRLTFGSPRCPLEPRLPGPDHGLYRFALGISSVRDAMAGSRDLLPHEKG